MFLAFKEKCFAKRVIRRLLKSYSAVSAGNPELSEKALYREVLLHTKQVDQSQVDQILWQAEGSIDEWTACGRDELGFREVAHFFIMLQHHAAGYEGAVVSFGHIVDSLIPADL